MIKIEDNIILYCAAPYVEEIYLKLTSNGYNVIAFCDNSKRNENIYIFGVPVYNYEECCLRY